MLIAASHPFTAEPGRPAFLLIIRIISICLTYLTDVGRVDCVGMLISVREGSLRCAGVQSRH